MEQTDASVPATLLFSPGWPRGSCLTFNLSLRRELVNRRLLVGVARSKDDGWEVRMVYRIGKMLGFQTEGLVLLVRCPTLPFQLPVKEITGIELNAWLGGEHLQSAA